MSNPFTYVCKIPIQILILLPCSEICREQRRGWAVPKRDRGRKRGGGGGGSRKQEDEKPRKNQWQLRYHIGQPNP
jgi:hypothetical protein